MLTFTKHAEARMAADVITQAEVREAVEHPTHLLRSVRRGRTLARRVHVRGVINVLYDQRPQGPLVVSCWRAMR